MPHTFLRDQMEAIMKFPSFSWICFLFLGGLIFSACDPAVPDITVECSTHSLISAINSANDSPTVTTTLHLSPGCVYELSDALIFDTSLYPAGVGLPAIVSPVVVDGQAATIQRSSAADTTEFRIFLVNSIGNLTLNNVVIRNGNISKSHAYGGAILNYGTLAINTSEILENSAYRGGAVYSTGDLTGTSSAYHNNQATFMGGAIQNSGSMNLTNSNFYDNVALYGGAIGNHTGVGYVAYSDFTNNNAISGETSGYGGAISNTSTSSTDTGHMVADICSFNGNHAKTGGAVANFNYSDFMLRESSLLNNSAQYGGAVSNQDEMEIIRCTLADNAAEYNGGAVFYQDTDDPMGMAIGNSTLSGNQISGGNQNGGSAVYHVNGSILIRHATITNNSGAAAFVEMGGDTIVENSIIANNSSGDCSGIALGSISVNTRANMDSDGSCSYFTITADPMLEALADNGGPTMTHALKNHSPALDAATTIIEYIIDQRTEIRPHGLESDLGAFESQEYTAGPIIQITLITPPPIAEFVGTVVVKEKEPDYYWWLFEGFVCSEMDLTEFYIRTIASMDTFKLLVNEKPVSCYQQSYDKERYWCYVEKRSLGWNTPVTIQYCEGEVCTDISRTTLAESKCQGDEAPSEPEKISCNTFTTDKDCKTAPGCIWDCSAAVTAKLCTCKETIED
jgi:hypothetical protein